MKKEYNLIVIFDKEDNHVLMCIRNADPYKGLYNFVGGKIERGEEGFAAAYRELLEETAITKEDVQLIHFMDFLYYSSDIKVEVYAGQLTKAIQVKGEENQLIWVDLDQDFFDMDKFAGEGNIGHILEQIKVYKRRIKIGKV